MQITADCIARCPTFFQTDVWPDSIAAGAPTADFRSNLHLGLVARACCAVLALVCLLAAVLDWCITTVLRFGQRASADRQGRWWPVLRLLWQGLTETPRLDRLPHAIAHGDPQPRNVLLQRRDGRWVAFLVDWESCALLPVGADLGLMLYYHMRDQLRRASLDRDVPRMGWDVLCEKLLDVYVAGLGDGFEVSRAQIRLGCLHFVRCLVRSEITNLWLGQMLLPSADVTCSSSRRHVCDKLRRAVDWLLVVAQWFDELPPA